MSTTTPTGAGTGSGNSRSSSVAAPVIRAACIDSVVDLGGFLRLGRLDLGAAEVARLQQVTVLGEVLGVALHRQRTVAQHVGPVGHLQREVDVLLDDEGRGTGGVVDAA